MSEIKLMIYVKGATDAEIQRGIAAAESVFVSSGVTAWEAAHAAFVQECEEEELADREKEVSRLWYLADRVAVQACCAGWPNPPNTADLEIVATDDERRMALKELDSRDEMVESFGAGAAIEAAMCGDGRAKANDPEGAAMWGRIVRAIEELQAKKPPAGQSIN